VRRVRPRRTHPVVASCVAFKAGDGFWPPRFGRRVAGNGSRLLQFNPLREAGARTDDVLDTPPYSLPPSVRAPAPCGAFVDERRVVVATKAGGCTDARAPPWSRSSPRALRCGTSAGGTVHEARDRMDNRPLHTGALIATFRCAAPAHCGAFADEGRVVAATEVNGNCQLVMRPSTSQCPHGCRRLPPTARGRSPTGVRVPDSVVRRGRSRGWSTNG